MDQTESPGPMGSSLEDATKPATFHVNVTLPDPLADGVILESGAGGQGMALWIEGSEIRFAVGDGIETSTSTDAVVISHSIAGMAGQTLDIVAAVDPAAGTAALYIDDCHVAQGATAGGGSLKNNEWAGTGAAGYGVQGSIRDGAAVGDFTATNGTLNGNMSFYENELPAGFPDDNATQSVSDLSCLTCSTDQIAKYDGSQWVCADPPGGGVALHQPARRICRTS